MNAKNYTGIVPDHYTGKIIDTESSVDCASDEEAKSFYQKVKGKLQNVNDWHSIAGELSASFQLVSAAGEEVNRPVVKGDYFKIDIPAPGPEAGDGYDWVKVEAVEEVNKENIESYGIRVRPSRDPLNTNKDVAHFYSDDSTSNFIVTREGTKVTAGVYDRNTKPNEDAESKFDKIRDKAVGMGALALLSKLQWKSLVDGLLEK